MKVSKRALIEVVASGWLGGAYQRFLHCSSTGESLERWLLGDRYDPGRQCVYLSSNA